MPWSGAQFHDRHNHGLTPAQSVHAAHIANAILARGAPEGLAIATANARAKPHRDDGGMVPPTGPNPAMQSPQQQGLMQRFQAMTPEQLQELLPRLGGTQVGQVAQRVLQQKRLSPPSSQQQQGTPAMPQWGVPAQQPTPALSTAPQTYASGGGLEPNETVPILAAGGEFVISPEHVVRLGDGDLKEGHRRLDEWVVRSRAHITKTMRHLKPPVRS